MALTRPRAYQIYDIDYKQATRVVTVANVTLTGGAPSLVDGVTLSLNDRVLVTGQSTVSQNGIYYVTTVGTGSNGTWSRSLDTNNTGEILTGTIVMVTEGLVYADTQWKLITDGIINVGVTDQVWTQNYSANSISSGTSNVVVNSNANVTISSAGTANVLLVSATGIVVTGTESVTGNATVGNLLTGGLISAAGNITGNGIQFNTSVTPITANTGQAFWDTGEHTVTLGMENGVQQQIGLENYMYVKASSAITNGQAVMFTGANGTNILAAPANTASVGFKSEYIIGVATQDIANNAFGYITVFGLVHGLNTNAWTVGDILWVDNTTPGALTNTQPTDPNYQIQMAAVTKKASGDGHIQVRVTPFFQLDRLRNVQTTSPTTGQALVYDGANSIWINGTAASANTAATVTTNAQPNITSVGTLSSLSVTGNVTGNYFLGNGSQLTGIVVSSGATITNGTSNVSVAANANVTVGVSGTANVVQWATTGEYVTGVVSASGNVTGNYILGNGVSLTGVVTSVANINSGTSNVTVTSSGGNVTVGIGGTPNVAVFATTGEYVTGVVSATGNITGSYIIGNGSQLTGLPAGYANSDVATYLASGTVSTDIKTTAALSATGNITGGNVLTSGILSASGNITGGNISATNHTGTTVSVTGTTTAASVVGGVITGSSTSVTGTTTAASVVGGVITGSSTSVTGTVTGASLTGTITTASQTNITGLGNITTGTWSATAVGLTYGGTGKTTAPAAMAALMGYTSTATAAGTTTLTNTSSYYQQFTGTSTQTVALPVTSTLQTGWTFHIVNNSTGNVTVQSSGLNTVIVVIPGTTAMVTCIGIALTTAADWESGITDFSTYTGTGDNVFSISPVLTTPNIGAAIGTSASVTGAVTAASVVGGVMTGTSLSVSGNVTAGGHVGTVYTNSIINTGANGVGNIGSASLYFNTVFAKATSAQYADLAEMYVADVDYLPGTVVEFGGEKEITATTKTHSTQVAGIVSTNPSYLMNATLSGEHVVAVALVGRVPCQVVGTIRKGDRLVASDISGVAAPLNNNLYQPGSIIGKALEEYNSDEVGIIEVAVGRH